VKDRIQANTSQMPALWHARLNKAQSAPKHWYMFNSEYTGRLAVVNPARRRTINTAVTKAKGPGMIPAP
jgi:hypothetical protein